MTMYNGVRFLEEQLDSLRLQLRKIDEVLIIDDDYKDNSVKMAQDYILKYNLYRVGRLPETKFADSIQKTIKWYLSNEKW